MKPDRTSGATTVSDKIASHLRKWLMQSKGRPSKAVIAGLEKECLKFLAHYPAMGNLYSLANAIGFGIEQAGKSSFNLITEIIFQIERWREGELKALRVIPQSAAQAIGSGKTMLTLSSSELAKQTLLALKQKKVRAFVLESRPLREGEKTAFGLAQAGIPTTLIIDAAFPVFEREVDAVLIGADRISKTLVNKIGSLALLEWAKVKKKPVFVVCQTSKFVPSAWCVLPLPNALSGEVSKRHHPKLQVRNFYFEECPLDLALGIITEQGVLDRLAIYKAIAAIDSSGWFGFLLKKLKAAKRPR